MLSDRSRADRHDLQGCGATCREAAPAPSRVRFSRYAGAWTPPVGGPAAGAARPFCEAVLGAGAAIALPGQGVCRVRGPRRQAAAACTSAVASRGTRWNEHWQGQMPRSRCRPRCAHLAHRRSGGCSGLAKEHSNARDGAPCILKAVAGRPPNLAPCYAFKSWRCSFRQRLAAGRLRTQWRRARPPNTARHAAHQNKAAGPCTVRHRLH
jgi:hypothetical protein